MTVIQIRCITSSSIPNVKIKIDKFVEVIRMKKETLLNIFTFLPLTSEVVSIFILPREIPIHYNANFQVTAYGSKYMLLAIGIITVLFGLLMKLIYKSNISTKSEAMVYRLSMIALLIFNGINLFALVDAFL